MKANAGLRIGMTQLKINTGGATPGVRTEVAADFVVDLVTGGGDPECSSLINLVNDTTVTIPLSDSNPGNLSSFPLGIEEVYYCIPLVPPISSQTYSTEIGGSWIVGYT